MLCGHLVLRMNELSVWEPAQVLEVAMPKPSLLELENLGLVHVSRYTVDIFEWTEHRHHPNLS